MRKNVMRLWAAILCASMVLGSVDVPASVVMASRVSTTEETTETVVDVEESSTAQEESLQETVSVEESGGEELSESSSEEVIYSEEEETIEENSEETGEKESLEKPIEFEGEKRESIVELASEESYWDKYSSYYFYNQLSNKEKKIWDEFETLCKYYMENEVDITDDYSIEIEGELLEMSELEKANWISNLLHLFRISHPQYYFVSNGSIVETSGNESIGYFVFSEDVLDGTERAKRTQEFKTQLDSWNQIVAACDTEYEKVKTIAQLISGEVVYDISTTWQQNAYIGVCKKKTVCHGYALIFELLCNYAGINSICVVSDIHIWNRVRIDGIWYNIDVTWMDEETTGINYDYFLKDNKYFDSLESHTVKDFITTYLPECSFDSGSSGYDVINYSMISLEQLKEPTITLEDNGTGYDVSISSVEENCKIFYSVDGSIPDESSRKNNIYIEPFTVDYKTTIKAMAVKQGYINSEVVTTGEQNSHTIFFDANGGEVVIQEKTVIDGNSYGSLPIPIKEEYIFTGWFNSENLDKKVISSDTVTLTQNITLYAGWKKEKIEGHIYNRTESGIDWSIDENGNLKINGTGEIYQKGEWKGYASLIKSATVELSEITNLSNMFYYCSNLQEIDLTGLEINQVTNLDRMFYYCTSLEYLDLSQFDMSNVESANEMLCGAKAIQEILTPKNVNIDISLPSSSFKNTLGEYVSIFPKNSIVSELLKNEVNVSLINLKKYFADFKITDLVFEKKGAIIEFELCVKNCGKATAETYFLTLYLKDSKGNIIGSGLMAVSECAENESICATGGITGTCEGVVDYEVRLASEQYTVTLDSQEATEVGTTSVNVGYGSEMPEITIPKKQGYQFRGYFNEPDGKGTQYYDSTGADVIKFDKIDAITLYAYWIEENLEIASTPTANHLSGSEVESGTEIILTTETEGASIYYTLDGTDPTTESTMYETPIVLTEATTIKAIAVKEGYENSEVATFTYTIAEPEKASYIVTFNSNGGSEVASQTIEEGKTVEKPADPTREGYIFKGWYLDGEEYDFTTPVTKNITLEAQWEIDESTYTGDVTEEDMPEGGIAAIPQGLWIAGVDENGYTYTGKAIKPEVRVYDHKTLLAAKKDYTISYKNNTKAADASAKKVPTITVTGKGNYSGGDTKTFTILKKQLQDSDIKTTNVTVKYNKKTQKVVPVVTRDGKKLKNKTDFTVSYPLMTEENPDAYKKPGTYPIEITGKANYEGTITAYVIITENPLMSEVKVAKIKNQPYTGGEVKPTLSVTYKGDPLTEGVDYTVEYLDNVKTGTATAVLTGKDSFAGEKRVTFKITGDSLKKAAIKVKESETPFAYTGSEIKPELEVTFVRDGKTVSLEENKNYTAEYTKNVAPGTATVTLTGINDFTGTVKKTFKIKAYDIYEDVSDKISITMPDEIFYEKGGSRPKPVVAFGDTILTEGKDYTLSYKKNTVLNNNANATVTIKGKGCFTKSITEKFCIAQKDISEVKITVPDKVYNNKKNGFKATPVLTDTNGKKLKIKTDYLKTFKYTYAEDTITEDGVAHKAGDEIGERDVLKVGTLVNVTVTGTNCYDKSITGQYRIIKKDIAKTKVRIKPQDYTGKQITLTKDDITIKENGKDVDKSEFKIIGYENNIKKGTAKVTIKGVGEVYGGTKTVKFTIRAKGFKWCQ